jgi:hypothetical protein
MATPLEQAASDYLKASDGVGRHLKNCTMCVGDGPNINCTDGLDVFRQRSHAFSRMSQEAFRLGLRT